MSAQRNSASEASSNAVPPGLLAKAWLKDIENSNEQSNKANHAEKLIRSISRCILLLEDASSVPFVCRYRTDVIDPLTTAQVHKVWELVSKHASLESLRKKLLKALQAPPDHPLVSQIKTSTSKAQLEDWYAPYKPPTAGSKLGRMREEHPTTIQQMEDAWNGKPLKSAIRRPHSMKKEDWILVWASLLAREPALAGLAYETSLRFCRIETKLKTAASNKFPEYRELDNFSSHLGRLPDHKVLAIRRGTSTEVKALSLQYVLDADSMEACLKRALPRHQAQVLKQHHCLSDVLHVAWTKRLRPRIVTLMWKEKCRAAQERATQVFADNLRNALLAPPMSGALLALDPGFRFGIKCAVLDNHGNVRGELTTVKFVDENRAEGREKLGKLLRAVQKEQSNSGHQDKCSSSIVKVALGNGHGSIEARSLIEEAGEQEQIPLQIHLVSESGASVWSVTPSAAEEFPNHQASAIAAVSIGRRLQNPLHELVKVPPRSLGLGMYQHDLSEEVLDDKLHLVSTDAVASIGVELNSCSQEILATVPGLKALSSTILAARPLQSRQELLTKVKGLGPKTFEKCAGFCRVSESPEPLDRTLVHPESYGLAKWLLRQQNWSLDQKLEKLPPRSEWENAWSQVVHKGSKKFGVEPARVMAVLTNLVDSMTQIDPRLRESSSKEKPNSIHDCQPLDTSLQDLSRLAQACPVHKILARVRNLTDFGAFVDLGASTDGLLHVSKIGGREELQKLLIGSEIGVDILQVDEERGRISLGLAGARVADKPPTRRHEPPTRRYAKREYHNGKGSSASRKRRKMK